MEELNKKHTLVSKKGSILEELNKSVCLWCKGECGVLVHVKDGKLLEVEEDPEWPRDVFPPTQACLRRMAATEYFYHPDRVNYPLKRVGERGEGKWERISWDQALDEIAEKLKEIKEKNGAEAVGVTGGTLRTHDEYRSRFCFLFGTPNQVSQSQMCFGPRTIVADAMVGMFPNFAVKPVTKCIVLLGVEPLISRPAVASVLLKAKDRGAKLIVIDPRRTRSASMADVWFQLRPGTNVALLLGMINVIINENLYDKEFVEKWCHGFDKLKERVNEYPPEKVEKITDVPAEKIREGARLYALNKPGTFVEGMGCEHLYDATTTLHARWILSALVGNVDVEGGDEQSGPPDIITRKEVELGEKLPPEQWKKLIGSDRFRLFSWEGQQLIYENVKRVWGKAPGAYGHQLNAHGPSVYRAIITGKPYPVKALITAYSNPMVTQANTKLVYKALKNLDLYVVHDFFKTPGAELADYILPAATWLERADIWTFNDYANYFFAKEAVVPSKVEGQYEHYSDFELWRGLGIRLGQKEYWPWKTLEEAIDDRLKPIGYTLKNFPRIIERKIEYKKYEKKGFGTPTGKVELYSTILEKLGYDPLPLFIEPQETYVSQPDLAKEYPLTLLTGARCKEFYHSEWRQIDSIRKIRPYPIIQIHPETAKKLEITDGDWVWVESPRGRVMQKVELFDGMAPNIVQADHGWWLPELPGEEPWLHGVFMVNINVLTSEEPDRCDPYIGGWPLKTSLCKIYKVKQYEKGEKDRKVSIPFV